MRTCIVKQLFSSLFESVSKEKGDRDQNVVQTFRDRQNLHKIP